jgi:hypothetical protein
MKTSFCPDGIKMQTLIGLLNYVKMDNLFWPDADIAQAQALLVLERQLRDHANFRCERCAGHMDALDAERESSPKLAFRGLSCN